MPGTAPALDLLLLPSRRLLAATLLLHTLILLLLLVGPLPWLATVALGNGAYMVFRDWYLLSRSCPRLQIRDDDCCMLVAGGRRPVQFLESSVLWSWLTVLQIRLDGFPWHWTLVLLDDSAPAGDLRSLRVWLRYRASFPDSGQYSLPRSAVRDSRG